MSYKQQPIFNQEQIRFNKHTLEQLKQHDLKTLFETLMTEPSHRTIADVNTLIKIMHTLGPIKRVRNSSVVYHLCRSMFIAKFKEKSFVYQRQQDAESLYIILSGKVGLYKRAPNSDDNDEVIFLSEGSSFGNAYNWKQKFLPLTFQETLLAVIPKRQTNRVTLKLNQQIEEMINALIQAKIFGSQLLIRDISSSLNLHRVPFGNFLIKEGQIPKVLFFIIKGTVSKHLEINKSEQYKQKDQKQLIVAQYSAGDYFPKEPLSECLPFSIIADSPCEVISIPKRCLKVLNWSFKRHQSFKGQQYYKEQLLKRSQWQQFKQDYIDTNLSFKTSKAKQMIF